MGYKTTNPSEALEIVKKGGVDLVFLDIHMQALSGMQFLKLCGNSAKVILTTAYDQYALESFELNAQDYLLKPISYSRFLKAAEKVRDQIEIEEKASKLDDSLNDYIYIKGSAKNERHKIFLKDIRYVEGMKNYLSVYTASERFVTYQTLRDMEALLPISRFTRIHKSYIVGLDHVLKVDSASIYLIDTKLPISDTYKKTILELLSTK